MPIWLPYLPAILSAMVELAKLLIGLVKDNKADEIKECSLAIEDARRSGDTKKLEEIIKKMREGKPCK
jgi:hypothetical protein